MSSESLHEPAEKLSPATIDRHRATVSLMEELEAVDWYDQRIDAATDEELKAVLRHNRDEEKEHAAMVLEWLRRHDPVLDQQLRTYLFKERRHHGGRGGSRRRRRARWTLAMEAWGSAISARKRWRHEPLDARASLH